MRRDQLAHLLRAASRLVSVSDIVVVGSQAILGSYDDTELPDEAIGSVEADLCFLDDPHDELADAVDGAIGEASIFHSSFGYYAQGVSITTATVPPGWRSSTPPPSPNASRTCPSPSQTETSSRY